MVLDEKKKKVKAHGKFTFESSNAINLILPLSLPPSHSWMVFKSFPSFFFIQCISILFIFFIYVFQTPLPIFSCVFQSYVLPLHFLCQFLCVSFMRFKYALNRTVIRAEFNLKSVRTDKFWNGLEILWRVGCCRQILIAREWATWKGHLKISART